MELCIPRGHLVVLAGPSCAGKTTLARKMCLEAPTRLTKVVAADTTLPKAMANVGNGAEGVIGRWLADCADQISQAYKSGAFVAFDFPCSTMGNTKFVLEMTHMMGVQAPVTLVKVYPDYALHREFAERRGQLTTMNERLLKMQYDGFAEVANASMRKELPWIVNEYLVTDPREVKLKFVA